MKSKLFVIFTLLCNSGFATELPQISHRERLAMAENLLPASPALGGTWRSTLQPHSAHCDIALIEITFKSPEVKKPIAVSFQAYLPKSGKKIPLVIEFPTIEGTTPLETTIGNAFCDRGFAVIVANVNHFDYGRGDSALSNVDQQTRLGVQATYALIQVLKTRPAFDPDKPNSSSLNLERIGLLGLSNGTISATLLAAITPEVKALELVVAAANVPDLLARSKNERIAAFRKEQLRHFHLADEGDYETLARSRLKNDPIYMAPLVPTENVLQLINVDDDILPTDTQIELWRAFGMPKSITTRHSHAVSVVTTVFFNRGPLIRFFMKRLNF